jgi:endonuclease/exonuclease/phosphatase family metal-dependent hydrolase
MSKPLKLIQLNCLEFQYFDEILKFLKEQNPDIVNLQEATTDFTDELGSNGIYLDKLAGELGMQVIYSPFTGKESQDKKLNSFGNAILTKLEIVDHGCIWLHANQNKAGVLTFEENQKLLETLKINRNFGYPMVYSQPKNLIWTLLKHEGNYFRNITTHFTATQKCTETLQMIQESGAVCNFIENCKDLPTIFTGDLNIHQKASCVENLKSKLNLVNEGSINSLTPSIHQIFWPEYIARDPSLKDGLSVDYVFQKGIKILNWTIPEVAISDHLPIVVDFELE